MSERTALLLACQLAAPVAHAGVDAFVGMFSGVEQRVIRDCPMASDNVTTSGPWSATYVRGAEADTFVGSGIAPVGEFNAEGRAAGSFASGTAAGVSKQGSPWSGRYTARSEGDRILISMQGQLVGNTCRFEAEIEASRKPSPPPGL